MATIEDVNLIVSRLRRLLDRARISSGPGAEWAAEVPGFGVHTYRVTGMKSPVELEDDLANLCIWVWSLKDYLEQYAAHRGHDRAKVEQFVDADPDLRICSDLANSAKHGSLKWSRTGRFLRTGKPRFTIPQAALGSLIVGIHEVQVDVSKPELVTFTYPMIDAHGHEVGDALRHLNNGAAAWERLLQSL